jgi:hypothetical protein
VTEANFTLLDETRAVQVPVAISATHVRIAPAALRDALGWELKPQGLCKDDVCVPVKGHAGLVTDDGVDLGSFAAVMRRPLAIDVDERIACLGASAADRAAQMASLNAPNFTLPDWQGKPHSLSDYRGKKVLLVAYASW